MRFVKIGVDRPYLWVSRQTVPSKPAHTHHQSLLHSFRTSRRPRQAVVRISNTQVFSFSFSSSLGQVPGCDRRFRIKTSCFGAKLDEVRIVSGLGSECFFICKVGFRAPLLIILLLQLLISTVKYGHMVSRLGGSARQARGQASSGTLGASSGAGDVPYDLEPFVDWIPNTYTIAPDASRGPVTVTTQEPRLNSEAIESVVSDIASCGELLLFTGAERTAAHHPARCSAV